MGSYSKPVALQLYPGYAADSYWRLEYCYIVRPHVAGQRIRRRLHTDDHAFNVYERAFSNARTEIVSPVRA